MLIQYMLLSPLDGDRGDVTGYHPSLIFDKIPSNMPNTKPISAIAMMIGSAASTRPKRVGKRRITPSSTGPMDVLRSAVVSSPKRFYGQVARIITQSLIYYLKVLHLYDVSIYQYSKKIRRPSRKKVCAIRHLSIMRAVCFFDFD
jgi:hypothetical protein